MLISKFRGYSEPIMKKLTAPLHKPLMEFFLRNLRICGFDLSAPDYMIADIKDIHFCF
jgi:hypothetical protein